MNRIREFFVTLFTHRAVISGLMTQLRDEQAKVAALEQAIRCRDHALVSLSAPFVEKDSSAPLKPIRLQRMSYSEASRAFERANSARFRDQDAERARKAAIANR
jgi:hypothetical protein